MHNTNLNYFYIHARRKRSDTSILQKGRRHYRGATSTCIMMASAWVCAHLAFDKLGREALIKPNKFGKSIEWVKTEEYKLKCEPHSSYDDLDTSWLN